MNRRTPPAPSTRVAIGKVVSYGGRYYARITDAHGETRDYGAYILRTTADIAVAVELRRLARKTAADPAQPSDYAGDGGSFELPDRLVTETEDDL